VQLDRIAQIPWTIGAGLAEIGFTLESFTITCSILRCSCGWGRMVCVMAQFSHSVGRRRSPLSKCTIYDAMFVGCRIEEGSPPTRESASRRQELPQRIP
jgi:hypothetical protein